MRAGLIETVLPIDARNGTHRLDEQAGGENVGPGDAARVGQFIVSFAVPEIVRSDGVARRHVGAAVHLIVQTMGIAAKDLVLILDAVIDTKGERPLVDVEGRQSEVIGGD